MTATVTITLELESAEILSTILRMALQAGTDPVITTGKTTEPRRRGKGKKTTEAAGVSLAPPPPSTVDLLGAPTQGAPVPLLAPPSAEPDATGITVDDLKAAIRTKVETEGLGAVKEIFAAHGGAKKLSELKETDYPSILAALKASVTD